MDTKQRWLVLLIMYGLFFLIGIAALAVSLGWVQNADSMFVDVVGAVCTPFTN